MAEWVGPVRSTFWTVIAVIGCIIVAIVLLITTEGSFEAPCYGAQVSLIIAIVAFYVYRHRLEIVLDHVYSRWDMDKDIVCHRLNMAMWNRGVRIKVDFWGDWVVFPLPPMSVVVRPGRKRTTVFVGPVTERTKDKAEGLKAFVEAAMGERSRPY